MFLSFLVFYQVRVILTAIKHAMVISKKASKIYKFFVLQVTFFSLKLVGKVFVSFIISSHVITESSTILAK